MRKTIPIKLVRPDGTLPRKIALFRALQLGDLLCAVPALKALRATFKEAEIVLIGLPWARHFVERYHMYVDRFIEFPGYPGLPECTPNLERLPRFFAELQHESFDVMLQMHGSGSYVNSIAIMAAAARSGGFYLPSEYCPDRERFCPYPVQGHELRRLLRLTEFLGVPTIDEEINFPLRAIDREEFCTLQERFPLLKNSYCCIHVGSRSSARQWSVMHFAEVAQQLQAEGLTIVLTGSRDELPLIEACSRMMQAPTVNLAGHTTVGSLACLLEQSKFLVCNDTGVSHIAAALHVPSVVLFSSSDPERWAPLDRRLHRAIHVASLRDPQQVADIARTLLQESVAFAA